MKRILQLIGTAACAWALGVSGTASAQEKITYNMAWLPQGSSIGPIVAAQRGWFKEAGIDVDIVRGYGGGRTANELDQGQFEIGYVDPISLVLNRNNGGKIRARRGHQYSVARRHLLCRESTARRSRSTICGGCSSAAGPLRPCTTWCPRGWK